MENFKIKSDCDNLSLGCSLSIPDGKIKGIVQIVHGMSEHRKRYFDFMEFLSKHGYVVIINDHRGHGESVKTTSDLGYFYDTTGKYIVEDIHQITKYIKDKYPNLPLYLFGHSMGTLVARSYLKRYAKEIDKLILSGAVPKNNLVNLGMFLDKTIMLFKGDHYRSKLLVDLSMGPYIKRFSDEKYSNAWVCSDIKVVKKYHEDPLSGFPFTTNGYLNLFYLIKDTYNKKDLVLNNKKLPILFIAGSNDPVIENEKKFIEEVNYLKDLGFSNINYKLYKDMRHEILNDFCQKEVYKDILDFIK